MSEKYVVILSKFYELLTNGFFGMFVEVDSGGQTHRIFHYMESESAIQ